MMKNRRNKKDCGLLPYDREDVYGLSTSSGQYCGWEITKFNIKDQWQYSKGEGVIVAVIDTGCDLYHDDLKDSLVQGKNFLEDKDPVDGNGHGSHVSGTIAATDNGLGMVGVAPKTKIMPLKALNDDGMGDTRAIAEAVSWAADSGADLITMSLGSPSSHPAIKQAINYACSKNVVVFCAAGNAGERSSIMYPAKYPNVVSIGAIDKNLERTSFTCSGEELDFLAPGHEIVSAVPGNKYAMMSGTSMSNPFAVGCASLLLSYSRKIKYSAMDGMLKTADDYINVFKKKSKSLSNPKYTGKKEYEGYGILYPVL
jgi:major intracellular serine protease